MSSSPRPFPAATPLEAIAVVVLCFGWFILSSLTAVLEGFPADDRFNDATFVGLVGTELVLGALALLMLRARGHSLRELLPTPSWRGSVGGLLLFALAMLAWSLVGQAFSAQELAAQPIADMAAKASVTLPVVLLVSAVNGLYEETFLVGYLVRGLAHLGASVALGVSVLVRVLYHLYQGPVGAVSVLVYGLVVGACYWRTRALWPVVFAHVLADVFAFA
jgi:membrane protease YdiL (CAAX protease family)